MSANSLYFGDNLEILRNEIRSESIDLIYLDPPFNSKANYNLLFRTPKGHEPHAQITAFEDTWHWGEQAEREFAELVLQPNTDVSEMMQALRRFLDESDVMAYLTMMTNRLLELHRVLKLTGSIYLHCDPTASHYLKIVMDTIFGALNFRNEIVWKRSSAHSDAKQGARHYGRVSDTILFYAKGENNTFNQQYGPYDESYTSRDYRRMDGEGRRFRLDNIQGPGGAAKGNPFYEVMGVKRYWRYSQERMQELIRQGRIIQTRPGAVPQYKRYLDEMPGIPVQNFWDDVSVINNRSKEKLGYPTQKPLALLERIIETSSNPGDVVLDPFCGCGTAVHAAQKLNRQWIGIDITHLAISLVETRVKDAFPAAQFEVYGTPKVLDSARDLAQRDKYQFQWWACSLVKAQPYQGKKKGADTGIDGLIYFQDDKTMPKKIVVSVKAGENVSVAMIRDLGHVINREKAALGLFVTLTRPTAPMRQEAVKAGFYVNPMGTSFPKIQILTIEGLLEGIERPHYFDLMQGGLMSSKPEREVPEAQLSFDSVPVESVGIQTPEETKEVTRRKGARVARGKQQAKPARKPSRKTA